MDLKGVLWVVSIIVCSYLLLVKSRAHIKAKTIENAPRFVELTALIDRGTGEYMAQGDTDSLMDAENQLESMGYMYNETLSSDGFTVFAPLDTTGNIVVTIIDGAKNDVAKRYFVDHEDTSVMPRISQYFEVKKRYFDNDTSPQKIDIVGGKIAHALYTHLQGDEAMGRIHHTQVTEKSTRDQVLCHLYKQPWC